MTVKVKICGITSDADALMVARAGADAIGINFYFGPRKINLSQAESILSALPSTIIPVALIDLTAGWIPGDLLELLRRHAVTHVQMYGSVVPETVTRLRCNGFDPVFVACAGDGDFAPSVQRLLDACADQGPTAVLLDAVGGEQPGGTGTPADWESIHRARESGAMDDWPPVLLAGGLREDNVAHAVALTQPWGVDVASGVESSPGRKDPALVRSFIQAARATSGT